jgi:hypothetical protein
MFVEIEVVPTPFLQSIRLTFWQSRITSLDSLISNTHHAMKPDNSNFPIELLVAGRWFYSEYLVRIACNHGRRSPGIKHALRQRGRGMTGNIVGDSHSGRKLRWGAKYIHRGELIGHDFLTAKRFHKQAKDISLPCAGRPLNDYGLPFPHKLHQLPDPISYIDVHATADQPTRSVPTVKGFLRPAPNPNQMCMFQSFFINVGKMQQNESRFSRPKPLLDTPQVGDDKNYLLGTQKIPYGFGGRWGRSVQK